MFRNTLVAFRAFSIMLKLAVASAGHSGRSAKVFLLHTGLFVMFQLTSLIVLGLALRSASSGTSLSNGHGGTLLVGEGFPTWLIVAWAIAAGSSLLFLRESRRQSLVIVANAMALIFEVVCDFHKQHAELRHSPPEKIFRKALKIATATGRLQFLMARSTPNLLLTLLVLPLGLALYPIEIIIFATLLAVLIVFLVRLAKVEATHSEKRRQIKSEGHSHFRVKLQAGEFISSKPNFTELALQWRLPNQIYLATQIINSVLFPGVLLFSFSFGGISVGEILIALLASRFVIGGITDLITVGMRSVRTISQIKFAWSAWELKYRF